MKTNVKLAAAAALAGLSFSVSAWWGPYGYPYGVGHAPVVAAPLASISEEQVKTLYNPWGLAPVHSAAYDPFLSRPGDYLYDPFMLPRERAMFRQSDAEREQALRNSEARREAFRARTAAQRAAMDARRQAWLASVRSYDTAPYGYGVPFGLPAPLAAPAPLTAPAQAPAPEATAEAPAAEQPAAVPAPQPKPVAAAPTPASY